MGVFLHTAVVQNKDPEKIKADIQKAAKKYSDMSIVSEKCVFVNNDRSVLIIFNEEANVNEAVVKILSKEICAPVMFIYIYDGDGWGYFYCEDGIIKDFFSVCPEATRGTSPEKYKDSAKFIAERFHINVNKIINYFKIWTDELIEDEVVAYEDDEFVYGDCWQMADFMKRLGILFPNSNDNTKNKKAVSKEEKQKQASESKIFHEYGSSTPYVCAFDYTYRKILMKSYESSLQDIIEMESFGKYRQARDELTKKIDSLKDNCNSDEGRRLLSGMYLLRGIFSRSIGNSWLARRDLDAAYELEPENIFILRQRIQLETSKGQAKKAIDELNTLMRIDEKNYDYYLVERAWRYYWMEEMEAARTDLMEAKSRGNSGKNDDFVVLCEKLKV